MSTAIKGLDRLMKRLSGVSSGSKSLFDALVSRVMARTQDIHIAAGFLEGATYPKKSYGQDKSGIERGEPYESGIPVAAMAALQEFGGTFEVPPRRQKIYRSISKDGSFKKSGRFVKKRSANFETEHSVGSYTVTIPSRPFMRNAIEKNRDRWGALLSTNLKKTGGDLDKALNLTAEKISSQIQDEIRDMMTPPNAQSTVRKKGRDKPLIDTGHMLNSVGYEVSK